MDLETIDGIRQGLLVFTGLNAFLWLVVAFTTAYDLMKLKKEFRIYKLRQETEKEGSKKVIDYLEKLGE